VSAVGYVSAERQRLAEACTLCRDGSMGALFGALFALVSGEHVRGDCIRAVTPAKGSHPPRRWDGPTSSNTQSPSIRITLIAWRGTRVVKCDRHFFLDGQEVGRLWTM
jgi:hypothetical protein